jgi:ubiquinone/menaquinone biosynthesis C-methylase UbiE
MMKKEPWYETAWSQATYEQFCPEWKFVEERAKEIIESVHLRPGMKILDVACGSGAETTALAILGYEITGVDFSSAMINIAKRISNEKKADVEWRVGDMRQLSEYEKYDLVMLRDVIFGVFDHQANLDVLGKLFNAVKKGGWLLLEVYNKKVALEKNNIEGFLSYNSINNRFEGAFERKTVEGNVLTDFASNEFFSVQEWTEMLSSLGLKDICFYPSLPAKMRGLEYNSSLVIDVVGKKV